MIILIILCAACHLTILSLGIALLQSKESTALVQMLRVGSGRTRCLQLAVGVTLANLLLSATLVYLSSSSTSSSSHGNQERLLLSVEYPAR